VLPLTIKPGVSGPDDQHSVKGLTANPSGTAIEIQATSRTTAVELGRCRTSDEVRRINAKPSSTAIFDLAPRQKPVVAGRHLRVYWRVDLLRFLF